MVSRDKLELCARFIIPGETSVLLVLVSFVSMSGGGVLCVAAVGVGIGIVSSIGCATATWVSAIGFWAVCGGWTSCWGCAGN